MVFGGLGRFRMTSLASCDRLTMASFKRTAVCMRRMLLVDSLILQRKKMAGNLFWREKQWREFDFGGKN
jgi:hypothetical protein